MRRAVILALILLVAEAALAEHREGIRIWVNSSPGVNVHGFVVQPGFASPTFHGGFFHPGFRHGFFHPGFHRGFRSGFFFGGFHGGIFFGSPGAVIVVNPFVFHPFGFTHFGLLHRGFIFAPGLVCRFNHVHGLGRCCFFSGRSLSDFDVIVFK